MKDVVNLKDIVALTSKDNNKKNREKNLKNIIELTIIELENGKTIKINGIGTFNAVKRLGRTCANPRNVSEKIYVPTVKVVKFKAATTLKKRIRNSEV